ncbi:amino acid adenylation domain-containing protein [Streptomyces sp. LP05-1]|uniref:Amino acid adenylation domain-containing protein n=1 Tax=Streptomyces pyxinae TaxID=2970734 RepID=A0ABT2CHI4_9ACTN|nr:amino acid adenylation domain-containing protein [Streptomyces sp. LP05-1]MCS0636861.1 amino acid adenylation domain-containing protein [Streptomyces sp. LP05-1]
MGTVNPTARAPAPPLPVAYTVLPRWTRAPRPGTAEHIEPLPAGLVVALRQAADGLGVPLASVLLAAHAKVLAALTGEGEVTTGLPAGRDGRPRPCRVALPAGSWLELVREAHRAAAPERPAVHREAARGDTAGDADPWSWSSPDAPGGTPGGPAPWPPPGDPRDTPEGPGPWPPPDAPGGTPGGSDAWPPPGDPGDAVPPSAAVSSPPPEIPGDAVPPSPPEAPGGSGGPEDAGPSSPPDTVFDARGGSGAAASAPVAARDDRPAGEAPALTVVPAIDEAGCALRLRYRTDVLDAEAAARIGGYYRTALTLLTAGPGAGHTTAALLSEAEVRFQTDGLAGPYRPLPDRRAHELFEDRVRAHPDAVAAEHRGSRRTFRELDARANRLARALLDRGLRPEEPVAVVMERDLDWMASVLGVLKAGGVYLPVEPRFPAERIARMLARAGCRLVLTEPGSTAELDRMGPPAHPGTGPVRLLVADACAAARDDSPPRVPVAAGQAAYLYFTSGSTGEPKGALCEHLGLLNHLYAKIDDLGIGEGLVVAQTAPQCFDISLWQLLAGPLAGGRTLLVEQAAVLDVHRFLDTVTAGRVAVLQLVPSYLDAVVSALEQRPRALPELRCVSVTGEALKPALVRRWFAVQPAVPLVNAYGLTETSDDTHHEVLRRPPESGRIPLGRTIGNVRSYVVDERLALVPLGAPGLIAFGGVCVGREYVNDPERTRECFRADPHLPGGRLYLGGDEGRWTADGKLEFLGRRDGQVKIRGFRIELGEVESALLRTPGLRDAAVLVDRSGGGGPRLVAYCAGDRPVAPAALRERLAARLPGYMVPEAFHWLPALPLTANGKTDRKALTALAARTAPDGEAAGPAGGLRAPRTAAEARLATAWAEVLGVPADRVGREDHFFERGGNSLSAVRLAVLLDRAVTLRDVVRHPVLADLAALLDTGTGRPPAPASTGAPPATTGAEPPAPARTAPPPG